MAFRIQVPRVGFSGAVDAIRADDTPVTVACVGWTSQPMADFYSRKLWAPMWIYQAELPRDGRASPPAILRVPPDVKPKYAPGTPPPAARNSP